MESTKTKDARNSKFSEFENLNFGANVTTGKMTHITARIDVNVMVKAYAKEYFKRLSITNDRKLQQTELTEEDLDYYFTSLLAIRVDSVNDNCHCFLSAQKLVMPSWFQAIISGIGIVKDYDHGFVVTPVMLEDVEYDIERLLEISENLRFFESDGFHLFSKAFPKDSEGDKQIMLFHIQNDVIVTNERLAHPFKSYMAAFIGMQLENYLGALALTVQYDDVNFISSILLHEKVIY